MPEKPYKPLSPEDWALLSPKIGPKPIPLEKPPLPESSKAHDKEGNPIEYLPEPSNEFPPDTRLKKKADKSPKPQTLVYKGLTKSKEGEEETSRKAVLEKEDGSAILVSREELEKEYEKYEKIADKELREKVKEWQAFYKKIFPEDPIPDFSEISVPERTKEQKEEFTRLIVVREGMTPNRLYDKCAERFPATRYTKDLNTIMDIVSRPDGSYAIWVRDRQEADEEMKNLSANGIKERNINTETLKERLINELKFFEETREKFGEGKHLDTSNWTLCASSRVSNGNVPHVYWDGARMDVDWCNPDNRNEDIRARAAIS